MTPPKIITADCYEWMRGMDSESVDLIATDPPFGNGYNYKGEFDDVDKHRYMMFTRRWLFGVDRLLKRNGSIFVMIGDEQVCCVKERLDALGYTMRNWIIWHYTFGPHQTKKFGRDHAHILYYVKNPKAFTFNADAIRVESVRQKIGDKRANPKGRVPSDVWQFPRLPGNAKERTGHPCQQPEALVERIVLAASNPGDVVLDPFCGSGTAPLVAARHGRIGIGIEQSKVFAKLARDRIKKELKT